MTELGHSRREPWVRYALVAVVLTAAAVGCTQIWDSDVPQHLASGDWMLRHGQIIGRVADPFGVDGPASFVNVHWGFQVFLSGLHGIGGFELLTIFKMAALAGVVAIVCGFISRRSGAGWVLLCGLVLVLGLEARVRARPELVTFVLLAATLVILEKTRQDGKCKRLWWLTPINILWVNTHGLFVLGLACLAMAIAGDWLDRWLKRGVQTRQPGAPNNAHHGLAQLRALPAAIAALLAVLLVTPWPIQAALHPLLLSERISGINSAYAFGVEELRPTYFVNLFASPLLAVNFVLAVVVAQLMLFAFRRVPAWHWLVLAFFVAMAAMAMRNVAAFAIPGVLLLGFYGPPWLTAQRQHWPWLAAPGRWLRPMLLAACVLLTGLCATERFYRWQGREIRSGWGLQDAAWPVRTARFLAHSGLSGDILALNFGDGGTFDLYAGPEHKVWMDGRLEVHSSQRFEKFYELRTRLMAKDSAGDAEQTPMPPSVRFLFVRWGDFKLQETLGGCDRFQLLYIEPAGLCFARKALPNEDAQQLAAWEKAQPLPTANTAEYDLPADMATGQGLPQFPLPKWYRCNPPPMLWRLGAMLYSLRHADVAMRYLVVSGVRGEAASSLERLAVLAQTTQRLGEALGIEPDETLPSDVNLSQSLALYATLDCRDSQSDEMQALELTKVLALLYGRQIDAAWTAMQQYLASLPIPLRWRPPQPAILLRDQIHQALRVAQAKAADFAGQGLSPELHARLLLRKDVGLSDQAIALLESAGSLDSSGRMLLGDLYLRRGEPARARVEYAKLAPAPEVTLRLGLCDWAGSDFAAASGKLKQVADTPSGSFYYALLLEQWGQYAQAVQALGPAPASQRPSQLDRQITRLRARLSGGSRS